MGGPNVLTGTVESNSGGAVRLRSAEGATFEAKADGSAAVGSKMSVSVRRDHVALRRGENTSDVNSIAGVVEATEYQGSYVKVTIKTAGGIFVANISDRAYFAEHVDTGDKVVASWSAEDVHVLSKVDTGTAGEPYLDGGH
jgi:putative spermidine/putrescine transport system ATP-binding protein